MDIDTRYGGGAGTTGFSGGATPIADSGSYAVNPGHAMVGQLSSSYTYGDGTVFNGTPSSSGFTISDSYYGSGSSVDIDTRYGGGAGTTGFSGGATPIADSGSYAVAPGSQTSQLGWVAGPAGASENGTNICYVNPDPVTGAQNCVGSQAPYCECTTGAFNNKLNAIAIIPSAGSAPEVAPSPSPKPTAAQASPGHLVMCWNALIYGAASATGKAFEGKGGVEAWTDTFQESSSSAAAAMTPVGGFVLKTHVFKSQ